MSKKAELVEEIAFGLFSDGAVRVRSTMQDRDAALLLVRMTLDYLQRPYIEPEETHENNALH